MSSAKLVELKQWYNSLTSQKPKGYVLSATEEAKRTQLVEQADAEVLALPKREGLVQSFELWSFAAVTAPTLGEAKDAAQNARDALEAYSSLAYSTPTDQVKFWQTRIDFILQSTTNKRGALTWSDAVGCPDVSFWDECQAQSSWLWWAVGAAVVVWYGRKRKWF